MANRNESGRYSLAGFVYQLIGTATEAFEIDSDDPFVVGTRRPSDF